MASFKSEVIADNSGKWAGNALRFATESEALTYVKDLKRRWILVTDVRVVESSDPVNYRIVDNCLEPID
jgi:hypothetical protein